MAKPYMSNRNTTNRAYYFARRKDTGMAGVWFTHCACPQHRENIIWRLASGHSESALSENLEDTRFPVGFLEDNFVSVVKNYCRTRDISIAMDLTLLTLRESGHDIKRVP